MELTMCCPTLFGLEGIVADELRFGGKLTDVRAENGRVFFEGDENTLAWANLNLPLTLLAGIVLLSTLGVLTVVPCINSLG